MWGRNLLLVFTFGLLPLVFSRLAAQDLAPEVVAPEMVQLGRIRGHMRDVLSHIPNYTCVETMERTRRVGPAHQFQMQDVLRMEVALVEGKEMFAWPGSKKFEHDDLRNLISSGTYGNGSFALFARAVFLSSAPVFNYRGEEAVNGHTLVRYDFSVSKIISGYQIRVDDRSAVVSYHGSFWADPQTLDAATLEVIADDIPPSLGLSYSADRIDYSRTRIADDDYLLPKESQLDARHPNGMESRNFVRFSSCRQYTGESVLRFDEVTGPDLGSTPKPGDEEILLPGGMELEIALVDDIDLASSAAGDEIHGTLAGDLKQKGKILAGKGAVILGRLTRLERYPDQTVVGFTFTDLYWNGKHAGLTLEMDRALLKNPLTTAPRTSLVLEHRPHEGLVQARAGRVILQRGMLMYWRT
jgi:hypothetical protein